VPASHKSDWTVVPAARCTLPVPKWPLGRQPTAALALWKRLWALPIARFWHEQQIEPSVVARYVLLALTQPQLTATARLEADLGLTPAGMARLRVVVERPETPKLVTRRYDHLQEEAS
jgi:hypothetical protein